MALIYLKKKLLVAISHQEIKVCQKHLLAAKTQNPPKNDSDELFLVDLGR
jgi:hypothetical protein